MTHLRTNNIYTIGEICDVKTGKKDVNAEKIDGIYPFFTCAQEIHRIDSYTFDDEAVLIAGNGFFNVKYYKGKFDAYQRTYVLHNFRDIALGKYIYYFVSSKLAEITKDNRGSTIRYIRLGDITEQKIVLPTIEEQDKAIRLLEKTLSSVDISKTDIAKTKLFVSQFRQAILTAAITGKLTEEWRKENGDYEWEHTILETIISEKPRNGYSPQPVTYPTNVKSLTLSATTSGYFNPEHFKYINEAIPLSSHLWLKPDDILIQRANSYELVGVSAIYTGKKNEFIYPDLMMKIRANNKALPKFIYYVLSSLKTRTYFRQMATGTSGNMPKINQKIVLDTPILLPQINEQREIVNRVDQYLENAKQVEKQIEIAEAQVSKLTQSVLAKTFN